MINYLRGWIETLRIKFFEPKLYRDLTKPFNMNDYEEVSEPKED